MFKSNNIFKSTNHTRLTTPEITNALNQNLAEPRKSYYDSNETAKMQKWTPVGEAKSNKPPFAI